MDILVRRFRGVPYVWKKAKFANGYIMVDDSVVLEQDIISIRNDNRKQYVVCSVCGTYFRKGSKKIEKHKEGCNDTHMCFGCKYLYERRPVSTSKKYKLLENGNYISKTTSEVSLYCGRHYRNYDISSQEAREYCIYNQCRNATIRDATGFFLEKPGAFDNIITVDKIIEVGYKEARSNSHTSYTYYTLKGRNSIDAEVNELNIVEGFHIHYKRLSYYVYYSKKYDELYSMGNGNSYKVWSPCDMTPETRSYIKSKIAELYD